MRQKLCNRTIKKNIIRLFVFACGAFISTSSFCQPTYSIPWATTQPQFVFPVYFEEASGMRDTVYYCYDISSHLSNHQYADSVFGQKPVAVDTNRFYAYFYDSDFCGLAPQQCDSQYKVSVSPLGGAVVPHFPNDWTIVGFKNGQLPLKISWDISTLYSDSLPFSNSSGQPVSQGRFNPHRTNPFIQFSENGQTWPASLPFPILVTDSTINSQSVKDSCTVFNINGSTTNSVNNFYFDLYFEPWTGIITSANLKSIDKKCEIYPIPYGDEVFVRLKQFSNRGALSVYDLTGKLIILKHILWEKNEIALVLPKGVYVFNFTCEEYTANQLIFSLGF